MRTINNFTDFENSDHEQSILKNNSKNKSNRKLDNKSNSGYKYDEFKVYKI